MESRMGKPLNDLNHAALARAVKQNLLAFFADFAHAPSCRTGRAEGLRWWISAIAHPWFNGLLPERPAEAGDEAMLAAAEAQFGAEGETPFLIWTADAAADASWRPLLEARGYRYDAGAPGMALLLDGHSNPPPLPPGLIIRRLQGAEALHIWVETVMRGFELPTTLDAAFLAVFMGLLEADRLRTPPTLVNYLGYLDGVPVATSNVFFAAGVAGVQFVATLPAARRRGLGAAMTLAPLADAAALGYRAAILQASEMGFPVYRSLGFHQVGRVDNYFRPDATHG
jgi:ribosomal protein S18 acetylase RimI-like enzyme